MIEPLSQEFYGRTFSAEEFAQIPRPPCPVCGTPIDLGRIHVTWNAEQEAREGRRYIVGMWDCPRSCDQTTGKRRHLHNEFGTGPVDCWFRCSCGVDERGLTQDELGVLMKEHEIHR